MATTTGDATRADGSHGGRRGPFDPPPEFTLDERAINMDLSAYELTKQRAVTAGTGVVPLTQPTEPQLELRKHHAVQYKGPKPKPQPHVPLALRDSSPYRKSARPVKKKPKPAHAIARAKLKRTVQAMLVHEARKEHGVSGDKFGRHRVRHPAKVKLPPALKPPAPGDALPGDGFYRSYRSESDIGSAHGSTAASQAGASIMSGSMVTQEPSQYVVAAALLQQLCVPARLRGLTWRCSHVQACRLLARQRHNTAVAGRLPGGGSRPAHHDPPRRPTLGPCAAR